MSTATALAVTRTFIAPGSPLNDRFPAGDGWLRQQAAEGSPKLVKTHSLRPNGGPTRARLDAIPGVGVASVTALCR